MTTEIANVKAVIFDMGEVLLLTGSLSGYPATLEKRHGLEPGTFSSKDFSALKRSNLEKLIIGEITLEDHDKMIAKAYNEKFGTNLEKFRIAEDYHRLQQRQTIVPAFLEIIKKLKDEGIQLALLTNIFFKDSERLLNTLPEYLVDHFDFVFESCRLGIGKPNLAIYTHVLDTMKIPAENCIFLDDQKPNIEAAAALGINTIHVTEDIEAAANQLKVQLGWESEIVKN